MKRIYLVWAAALTATLAVPVAAQAPSAPKPQFAAVSVRMVIKNNRDVTPGGPGCRQEPDAENPQRITRCGGLRSIIQEAYGLTYSQLAGGPDWLHHDGFALQAITNAPTDHATKMLMLQAALEDKFQLKLQANTKTMPVLALVVAPGGVKFQPVTPDHPDDYKPPTDRPVFSFKTMVDLVEHLNAIASSAPRARASNIDKPVVDETGMTGDYAMHLLPELPNVPANFVPPPGVEVIGETNYPVALEKQLGLQLVPKTEPYTIYTIESAVEPAGDGN